MGSCAPVVWLCANDGGLAGARAARSTCSGRSSDLVRMKTVLRSKWLWMKTDGVVAHRYSEQQRVDGLGGLIDGLAFFLFSFYLQGTSALKL